MNLIKRTLMAASGMAALTTIGIASAATVVPVTPEMISAQTDRVLMMETQLQWVQAQTRHEQAVLQQMLEARHRSQPAPTLEPLGAINPGEQGSNCSHPDGGQAGTSCGGGGMMLGMMQGMMQGGMMQGMMQKMAQMMGGFMQ
jgi:hypothetical protein